MLILGLNAYHADSAACIMKDGCLVAAAEEERFRRIKHWAGLPTQAIDFCLREVGASLGEVDHIAINRRPGVNNWRRLGFVLTHLPDPRLIWQKIQNIRSASSTAEALEQAYGLKLKAQVHQVEHHLAHLASAVLLSGFEEAACLSVDGFGDFASTALGWGGGGRIEIDQRVYFPHSLGIFYSAITQFIGFPHYGDEYKVMGLAPYGEPKYPRRRCAQLVRIQPDGTFRLNLPYFRHHTDNVSYSWKDCAPEVGTLYTEELCASPARRSPAQPGEAAGAETQGHRPVRPGDVRGSLLRPAPRAPSRVTRRDNLALAGGCAMNSVANGKVYLQTPFKKMYLPAAAGDAGGAIGAAAMVAAKLGGTIQGPRDAIRSRGGDGSAEVKAEFGAPSRSASASSQLRSHRTSASASTSISEHLPARRSPLQPRATRPHRRPAPSPSRLLHPLSRAALFRSGDAGNCSSRAEVSCPRPDVSCPRSPITSTLCHRTARAIADGKVVGWFQGRMEWGPRALGNRSILGDPRRADMKDILNAKIKRRESFRPFAPSILREHVADWFEQDDDVPYMMEVFQIREEKRSLLPAVCHVDGSGRLQTVHREINPLYHQLISSLPISHLRPARAQHFLQRKRARRLPPRRSARLLPPHEDGRPGARELFRGAESRFGE